MKNRYLLSALLTMLFCCFMTSVDAQCTKTKKSSCTKSKTEQTKKSCSKSYEYTSCSKYKKSDCGKKNQNASSWNNMNTIVALGAVAFDNDNPSFTTGLEYTRQVGNQLGLGLLGEVALADNSSVKVGIPVSYYLGRRLKVSASPLAAFQQKDVVNTSGNVDDITSTEGKDWDMALGARAGVSYLINMRGMIVAPTARIDYSDSKMIPSVGVNVGFGF